MIDLDGELGFGTSAAAVGGVGVARELDDFVGRELQDFLELLANSEQNLLTLLDRATLATGHIAVSSARDALTYSPGPDADTEKGLTDVDNNAHHLAVVFLLEGLSDRGQHGVEPEVVNVNAALVLELIRPLSAVLILRVLPFRSYTLLEEVVVGLQLQFGDGCDIVLEEVRLDTY